MDTKEEQLRWESVGRRMDGFEERLDLNTTVTRQIKKDTEDIIAAFNSWRGAMVVLTFIGKLAKPLSYIAAAATAVGLWWSQQKGVR